MPTKRVLYLQYTNPGGYPPLIRSSSILADHGYEVRFFGIRYPEAAALTVAPYPNIQSKLWNAAAPGLRQKVQYALFQIYSLLMAFLWRPQWIYVSDTIATPIGFLLARLGFKVIYHEHDSPESLRPFLKKTRQRLAQLAKVVVIPNQTRLDAFVRDTGRTGPSFQVWNTRRRDSVLRDPYPFPTEKISMVFAGSLSEPSLPVCCVDTLALLPPNVHLNIIGYTTTGWEGYPELIRHRAKKLRVEERVHLSGPVPYSQLLEECVSFQIGLALFSPDPGDFNFFTLPGASNKVFQYLSDGQVVLVTNAPQWRNFLNSEEKLAVPCDRDDPKSIATAVRWILENPSERDAMRRRGLEKCRKDWNYETCFQPVLDLMESAPS